VALVVIACAALLAACDSNGSSSGPVKTTPTTVAPVALKSMQVDLVVTGKPSTLSVVLKGTKGTCRFPSNGLPASYVLNRFEYPQLGFGGSVKVYGRTVAKGKPGYLPSNVTAYIQGMGLVSPYTSSGILIAPDQQSIKIDASLSGGLGGSFAGNLDDPTNTLTARITGTIRCV
jgi:hypothetical protein